MYRTFVSLILTIMSVFASLQGIAPGAKAQRTEGTFLMYGPSANQCKDVFLPEKPGGTADAELITFPGVGHHLRTAPEGMQRELVGAMLAWADEYH